MTGLNIKMCSDFRSLRRSEHKSSPAAICTAREKTEYVYIEIMGRLTRSKLNTDRFILKIIGIYIINTAVYSTVHD